MKKTRNPDEFITSPYIQGNYKMKVAQTYGQDSSRINFTSQTTLQSLN